MSTLFDDLREGLQEAIEYEKGNGKGRMVFQRTIHRVTEPVRIHVRKADQKTHVVPHGGICLCKLIIDQLCLHSAEIVGVFPLSRLDFIQRHPQFPVSKHGGDPFDAPQRIDVRAGHAMIDQL